MRGPGEGLSPHDPRKSANFSLGGIYLGPRSIAFHSLAEHRHTFACDSEIEDLPNISMKGTSSSYLTRDYFRVTAVERIGPLLVSK
jgi:hypothetical protein